MQACRTLLAAASIFFSTTVATNDFVDPATIAACTAMQRMLPSGNVYYPGDPIYTTESINYWSSALSSMKPACMVMPTSAQEVISFVNYIRDRPEVKYVVKSGGHSPNPGWASTSDGLLLSFAKMKGAVYNASSGLAEVYPGGRWKDVVGDLAPYGKTVVGGRLDMVGVGGYLLGGGISFLSTQYGLAGDNIVNYEVVMANGSLVNVNAQTNPDLLVAMRGGGNAFGLVTKYTMNTVPIGTNGKVWGGPMMISDSNRNAMIAAFHNFTANPVDPKASIIMSLSRVGSMGSVWVLHRFYDGERPPKGAFMGFEDIWGMPGMDWGQTRTYGDLLSIDSSGGDILGEGRTMLRAMTHPLLPGKDGIEALQDIVSTWWNEFQRYQDNNFLSIASIALQSFPSSIGKAGAKAGGNALGLTANDGPRVMFEFATIHVPPASDIISAECGRSAVAKASALMAQRTAKVRAADSSAVIESYLPMSPNHAAFDQDPYASFKGYAKFRDLAKQVDPDGLWKRMGGFKYK